MNVVIADDWLERTEETCKALEPLRRQEVTSFIAVVDEQVVDFIDIFQCLTKYLLESSVNHLEHVNINGPFLPELYPEISTFLGSLPNLRYLDINHDTDEYEEYDALELMSSFSSATKVQSLGTDLKFEPQHLLDVLDIIREQWKNLLWLSIRLTTYDETEILEFLVKCRLNSRIDTVHFRIPEDEQAIATFSIAHGLRGWLKTVARDGDILILEAKRTGV
jgi:hypothetical protein